MTPPAIAVEGLTVKEGGLHVFSNVGLTVPAETSYVVLGKGAGPRELLRCVLGERKPDAGSVRVLGLDARRARRKLRSRILAVEPGGLPPASPGIELVVLDDPDPEALARSAGPGRALFAATQRPGVAETLGGRVGILGRGRLAAEGTLSDLLARFRRIRYANRLTETRAALGTELDEFDAARVRVRGWGIEAVVSNFDPGAFERFRTLDGVEDAAAERLSLAEILDAVAGI